MEGIKAYVKKQTTTAEDSWWDLEFHIWGKSPNGTAEIALIGEAIASSQELATSVAATARVATIVSYYFRVSAFIR